MRYVIGPIVTVAIYAWLAKQAVNEARESLRRHLDPGPPGR